MNIYLNNLKHGYGNSSVWKSSCRVTPFYFIAAFILFKFYTEMGFSIRSLPYIHKILPYLCITDLLSGISFAPIILILST